TAYTYDHLSGPTQVTHSRGATVATQAQVLHPTGRRTSVTEHNGRNVSYTYDALYRLTGETVTGDATAAANGSLAYTYDAVANRLSRVSTLAAIPATTSEYDANDRLTSEAYDANGTLRAANGVTYTYDFEDRLRSVNGGTIRLVYDGDGNRVAKTVGGVTTRYLVDDLSPTGYSEVVEEVVAGAVQRVYTYGEQAIGQRQQRNGNWQISFYGVDAHGSVRFLTGATGTITDTYAYDAFGILTSSTGTTLNNYLFNGQQYDSDLGFYFKRARFYSQEGGRFLTIDPMEGRLDEPVTLHRYVFANADPVNRVDPWGTSAIESGLSAKFAVARAAAFACVRNVTRTLLTETATELLTIYAVRQVGAMVPYGGRTNRTTELRFAEHLKTDRFSGGMKKIGEFSIRIPQLADPKDTARLIRVIEQMVIEEFGGTTKMLNSRNEVSAKKYPKYRQMFCGK
ncbi:MAG TPA: RHS repeat-associated core domain-containing protein, partial [Thermoanaerobaculia bacterium]|nr:RHS repeat-associated core domain-containing protein [Thermoanaerobaculia bacterium]